MTGTRLPRGRTLSTGELRALFEACRRDAMPVGARDAALLALSYGAGLRRSELVETVLFCWQFASGFQLIHHRDAHGIEFSKIYFRVSGGKRHFREHMFCP